MDFDGEESPFADVDTEYYLRLVEWTGRNLRADKPGYIPVELEGLLDRFGLDASVWSKNVRAYGSLFHRIAGPLEQLLEHARKRGQRWFCGQGGRRQLYAKHRQPA
jgi:putative transposase